MDILFDSLKSQNVLQVIILAALNTSKENGQKEKKYCSDSISEKHKYTV